MNNFKFFRNVFCNVILGAIVITILTVSISAGSITVSGSLKPIYKGESATSVSLMVNVYSGTEYIAPMLEIFQEHGVFTTFFVGGSWVAQNEGVLKQIHAAGHEIGNQGYYNKEYKKVTEQRNKEEIDVNHRLVKSVLGIDMTLFAPPNGSFSSTTLKVASMLGYKTIMWTVDTLDLQSADKTQILSRATKNMGGGCLVLMHPTKATVEALPDIIRAIKQKGLNAATVTATLGGISV